MSNVLAVTGSQKSNVAWGWVGLGAAVVAALGSMLPWASVRTVFGSVDVAGTTGDGKITVALAVAAAVTFLVAMTTSTGGGSLLAAGVVSAVGAAVAGYDLMNASSRFSGASTQYVSVSVGVGLYVCVVGFGLATVAAFTARAQIASARASFPPPTGQRW